jgi:uncharacterized protein (TIGR02145 family)
MTHDAARRGRRRTQAVTSVDWRRYGFRVLPAGYRNNDGSNFNNRGTNAWFWSSSANSPTNAWNREFNYNNGNVNRNNNNRSNGFSVRCIRDSHTQRGRHKCFFFMKE